jgi:hypothetical protein
MPEKWAISGHITQQRRSAFSNALVRAFNKDLPSLGTRGERQLGADAVTDSEGRYEVTFSADEFQHGELGRRAKLRPDLFIRVFDGDTALAESPVHFNAPRKPQSIWQSRYLNGPSMSSFSSASRQCSLEPMLLR